MSEMTLSSRHMIRNSSPGGLRPSTLPLGHGGSPQYWLSHVDGEETFSVSFKLPRPGTEPRTLAWKAAVLTTTLGPPPTKGWSRSANRGALSAHRRALFTLLFSFKQRITQHAHHWTNIGPYYRPIAVHLLTVQVTRYCLLPLRRAA